MAPDTVFLGGTGVDGLAVVGGVWDFEDGTMQGWAALDDLDLPGGPASITCPLTNDPANDFVLLAANRSGVGYPHHRLAAGVRGRGLWARGRRVRSRTSSWRSRARRFRSMRRWP